MVEPSIQFPIPSLPCAHTKHPSGGATRAVNLVFIRTCPLEEDIYLYEGIFSEQIKMEATKYPLYKQILEMEAVELHRLEQLIKQQGGKILDRNTDAIRYSSAYSIALDHYWDDNKTVVKYQNEEPTL